MTASLFHRPARSVLPVDPPEQVVLATPPSLRTDAQTTPLYFILPVVGALSSVIMMVVLRNGQPLFLMIAGVVFIVAIVGGVAFALTAGARAARDARIKRELYLDYLERTRVDLRLRARDARNAANVVNRPPSSLAEVVRDPERLWDRRRSDPDALDVRIGIGDAPWFRIDLPLEENPTDPLDPILVQEAKLLVEHHGTVIGMPVIASLKDAAHVAVIGPRERTVPLVRAMVAQLASAHSPDDLLIAAAFSPERAHEWSGLDLLPHVQDPRLFDGPVPARRIAPDLRRLASVLGTSLTDRTSAASAARRRGSGRADLARLVIVVDDHGRTATSLPLPDPSLTALELGITLVHLVGDRLREPGDVDTRISLDDTATITTRPGTAAVTEVTFEPDALDASRFESTARSMSKIRTTHAARSETSDAGAFDVTDLLGIASMDDVSPERLWNKRSPAAFLRVPFAIDDHGMPVHLDLKENAQQGMGPHGICVGATGSGKSEMLRTLILALALGHSPEDLSMILIDYKGGAAFAPFAPLPHLSGLIDNLADDPQLTTRARASLHGEVLRRQRLLKDADSSPSITHYRALREQNPELAPLPHLFVVIDEFGELLTAEPDFVDLFLQIGRIGRSIGIHLLLSSQRIEAGKLRGVDTYLSYRLGLRTFSEAESQVVLDTKDAFHLPAVPGYGILKVDTSMYQRFRAGYVSGPVPSARHEPDVSDESQVFELSLYNGIGQDGSAEAVPELHQPETGRLLVDEAVDRLRSDNRRVGAVWLPPLPERFSLGRVLSGQPLEPLTVTVGLEDRPAEQRQDPWTLDLTKAGGHVMIVGGPGSGRSTLLRTIGVSFALTATPQEVSIYGMDLAGGGLTRLEGFPHVGGVATRGDRGKLHRLLEEVAGMLAVREKVFREQGIESMTEARRMRAANQIPEIVASDLVLLVDGYGGLRQEFEEIDDLFASIMLKASNFGIHLVLAMTRSSDLRMAHQALFGTRIELRLNDPGDSGIDRKLSQLITADTPGRALTDAKLLAQVALPTVELVENDEVGSEIEALATQSAAAWSGPAAAPIRLLPLTVDPSTLPSAYDEPYAVPLGLRQDTMEAALWDFAEIEQHLVVLGDSRSGKSNTLRRITAALIDRFTPEELAIALVDMRGSLTDLVPDQYLAAHARTAQQATGLAESIATELAQRPGRTGSARESAPRVLLLVDDHDIVAAGGSEPLAPLLEHLPAARDSKFHLVVTRPVAGATRALYGPLLQGARDAGGSVLILSGDRAEGQILPRIYPERFPPGRGRYVRRGERPYVVQVAMGELEDTQ